MSEDRINKFVEDALNMKPVIDAKNKAVEDSNKRTLIDNLIGLRTISGLSREEMACRMKTDIFKVIAIESMQDQEDLTLRDFRMYVEALGLKAVVRIERRTQKSEITSGCANVK